MDHATRRRAFIHHALLLMVKLLVGPPTMQNVWPSRHSVLNEPSTLCQQGHTFCMVRSL